MELCGNRCSTGSRTYDGALGWCVGSRGCLRSLIAVAGLAAPALPAFGQPYEVRWFSVDGGGTAQAAGGPSAVGGTAGQPDAGYAVGSPYAVASGFWAARLTAAGAELRLTITDTPDPVSLGANLAYTITVTNFGPADATGVDVGDPAPPDLVFVSNEGDCGTPFPCSLGSIAVGETRTFTSTFQVPIGYAGPDPITATATVTAATPDPNTATNTDSVQTAVGEASADLVLTKLGPATAFRGGAIVYSITVTNEGPSDVASVEVTDAAPPGLVFVSNTGDCTSAFPCSPGPIPVGQSRVIAATFQVPLTYAGPDPIVNAAAAASGTPDPVPANNSDEAASVLTAPPGIDFFTIAPCRLVDTRNPAGPLGGPPLAARESRRFVAADACDIPLTALAISVNVAVTAPTAAGNLRLYPAGAAVPNVSSINYSAGQTRTNNAIVGLGLKGDFEVYSGQSSGTAHVIFDVNGYFQ